MTQDKRAMILEAAKQCFLASGFDGASIAQIAKQSGVAKSLVFHHFQSKENLWRTCKAHVVQSIQSPLSYSLNDLTTRELFLRTVIEHRFWFYQNNPEVERLMAWQRLQDKEGLLKGGTPYSPNEWLAHIRYLQEIGEINAKLNPEDIILMIRGSVQGAFMDVTSAQQSLKQKQRYIHMVIETLNKAFAP